MEMPSLHRVICLVLVKANDRLIQLAMVIRLAIDLLDVLHLLPCLKLR